MNAIDNLINQFSKLPSIGKKSAQRLAYYILNQEKIFSNNLSSAILEAKEKIKECSQCHNYTENSLCPICLNTHKNQNLICVIEKPEDILSIERFGHYNGLYHVLGNCLSPIDGIGPKQLNIETLIHRIQKLKHVEIILALNTSTEGEATHLYLKECLNFPQVKITQLARGIPSGSDLQFIDEITIEKALENRITL